MAICRPKRSRRARFRSRSLDAMRATTWEMASWMEARSSRTGKAKGSRSELRW
jgi:hypothetical protein